MMTMKKTYYALVLATAIFAQTNANVSDYLPNSNLEKAEWLAAEIPTLYHIMLAANAAYTHEKLPQDNYLFCNNILLRILNVNIPEILRKKSAKNFSTAQYITYDVINLIQSIGTQGIIELLWSTNYNFLETQLISRFPEEHQKYARSILRAFIKIVVIGIIEKYGVAPLVFGMVTPPSSN